MINIKPLIVAVSASILCVSSAIAFAASETTEINVSVTHVPYVKLIGTAPGSSRFYGNNDIANWIFPSVVDLGTLGLETNVGGNCDINFSTLNNFDLLHTLSNNSLTKYKILYQSQEFGLATNPTLSLPCDTVPTTIEFTPTQIVWGNLFPANWIEPGVYSDTVTVVVTTQ